MQVKTSIEQSERLKINEAIQKIEHEMKLINFMNYPPPFFSKTLSKFRKNNLKKFIKNISFNNQNTQQMIQNLLIINYIINQFDQKDFHTYATQLINPYQKKVFNQNYTFDGMNLADLQKKYHLKKQITQIVNHTAQWLIQIEATQDLLSRIQLYFNIQVPDIIKKAQQNSKNSTWSESFYSGLRKLGSAALSHSSGIMDIATITILPFVAIVTLSAMSELNLSFKPFLEIKTISHLIMLLATPRLLSMIAKDVDKIDHRIALQTIGKKIKEIIKSLSQFNKEIKSYIIDCTLAKTQKQYLIKKTNLQKIVHHLKKNVQLMTHFKCESLEQMKERTQAYFQEYIEIHQDQWTLVIPSQGIRENQIEKQIVKQHAKKQEKQEKISQKNNHYLNKIDEGWIQLVDL